MNQSRPQGLPVSGVPPLPNRSQTEMKPIPNLQQNKRSRPDRRGPRTDPVAPMNPPPTWNGSNPFECLDGLLFGSFFFSGILSFFPPPSRGRSTPPDDPPRSRPDNHGFTGRAKGLYLRDLRRGGSRRSCLMLGNVAKRFARGGEYGYVSLVVVFGAIPSVRSDVNVDVGIEYTPHSLTAESLSECEIASMIRLPGNAR